MRQFRSKERHPFERCPRNSLPHVLTCLANVGRRLGMPEELALGGGLAAVSRKGVELASATPRLQAVAHH